MTINRRIVTKIKDSLSYFPVVAIVDPCQVGKTPSSDDYIFKERIRICSLKSFIFNYLPAF